MILKAFTGVIASFLSFSLLFIFTKAKEFTPVQAGATFTFTGNADGDTFGWSVSNAGDINNDGYDDILIGACYKNSYKGAAYVIYGGEKSSLEDLDLSNVSLDPDSTGFVITGNAAGDLFGWSVSTAGDMNKDGYADIIIGAYGKDNSKGAAYVIYGGEKSSLPNIDLSSTTLDPAKTGFIIKGNGVSDSFGWSVSSAGDINNDGYADIIIGASKKNSNMGAAYVIYGGEKSSLPNIDLATTTLNPSSTGFMMKGNAAGDSFGWSVSSAGDINKDGYADLIVGAYGKNSYRGAAYVIYGGAKSSFSNIDLTIATLNPLTTGFMITGNTPSSFFGWSVSSAGDINSDGYADIMIGATRANSGKGAVFVVYGGDKAQMKNTDLSSTTLDPLTTGFMVSGNAANDQFGYSLSSAGDINKDGIKDILIGTYIGKAYIIYGNALSLANIDLSGSTSYPIETGFLIPGDSTTSQFGRSVGSLDINNDGFSDILIGAPSAQNGKGAAYLMIYNECPRGCKTCPSTSACTECFDGFVLENSQCAACPSNCHSCSIPSLCDVCSTDYYLFQAQCLDACPLSTFPTVDNICISCSAGCTQCTSDSVCQTCADGFTLSDSKSCVIIAQQIPEEKKGEKASAGAFEGTSLIGASLTSGSSLPLNFGMVAKILRNVKYIDITVSPELTKTFYSWKVASGFMAAPKSWSLKSESKDIPGVFSRYGLNPVFLINFWKPFVFSLIGLAVFLVFKSVEMVLVKNNDQKTMVYSISKHVNIAASNFALTQFYSNLDDAILYFIIEVRSTEFDTGFRIFSTILAVIVLMLGGVFVGLHTKLLNNYQSLKAQKAQTGSSTQLETFVTKCENIRLIMRDFKDITLLTQSFLLINLIRSVISSLIFAILFAYPVLQITLLFVLNIFMIIYLLAKRPFKELFDTCGQLFCEVVLLIANICIFILAVFDHAESYPIDSIKRLSQCIIALNYILLLGCAVLLVISIGKIFYTTYQERKNLHSVSVTPTMMTESTVKIMNNRSTMMNQSEMAGHNNFAYERNALETGNNATFDNQMLTCSHRIPINYEAQNVIHPIMEEDLSQSNIFPNNVFHSSQFIQDRSQRKMRGVNQRNPGIEMTNSSYEGLESRVQDHSGVLSQGQTNRTDANLVNLDAVRESSSSQWGMPAPANFMPRRKIRRNEDMILRITRK